MALELGEKPVSCPNLNFNPSLGIRCRWGCVLRQVSAIVCSSRHDRSRISMTPWTEVLGKARHFFKPCFCSVSFTMWARPRSCRALDERLVSMISSDIMAFVRFPACRCVRIYVLATALRVHSGFLKLRFPPWYQALLSSGSSKTCHQMWFFTAA